MGKRNIRDNRERGKLMYKVEIETKKGKIVIYLENLFTLEKELIKYEDYAKVTAKKLIKRKEK